MENYFQLIQLSFEVVALNFINFAWTFLKTNIVMGMFSLMGS